MIILPNFRGTFSEVAQATDKETGKVVALKTIDKSAVQNSHNFVFFFFVDSSKMRSNDRFQRKNWDMFRGRLKFCKDWIILMLSNCTTCFKLLTTST